MRGKAIDPHIARRLLAVAFAAFALWPAGAAQAAPPSVTSVTLRAWDVTVRWTLPEGMKAYAIEIAASQETYADGDSKGSFLGENWAHAAILLQTPDATSWSGRALPGGTYYAHVAAFDGTTCASPLALGCAKEWSEPVEFSVPERYFPDVGFSLSGGAREPYFSWDSCCLFDFDIKRLEIATDPDVNADGPSKGLFLEENLVLAASAPFTTPTSYRSTRPLAGGTYYWHAVGVDRNFCPPYDPSRLLCRNEISKAAPFGVSATPPVLTFAGLEAGAIDLAWTLPPNMYSDFVEVATAPDVYPSGPLRGAFLDENLVLFDDSLFPRERTYTAADPLPPGTYYVHVAAYVPNSCSLAFPPGCFDDYSDTARITIPGPPVTAPQTAATPPAASADRAAAFSILRVRTTQSVRTLSVLAALGEDASVQVTGHVSVSGSARTFKLKSVKRNVTAGRPITLRLRLSKRPLAIVLRAIARHRPARARLTVTARDRAGNEAKQKRTIKLRR
jgi:hypothetical protein